MALRNIRANVLPSKVYLRGCLQYAAPAAADARDLETNEALLDEDDLDTFRAWLHHYAQRYPCNREVLYSPWLVKDYGAGGSYRIVLITCLVGEYAMRIWRALSLAESGLNVRFHSPEAAEELIGRHLRFLRALLNGGYLAAPDDVHTEHGRFFNGVEDFFRCQQLSAASHPCRAASARDNPYSHPPEEAHFVDVSLHADRDQVFRDLLHDFESADRLLHDYCTALDLFWGTDCPLRASYETRAPPEALRPLDELELGDFAPRPVLFFDEFPHFELFVYSRYQETLRALAHETDEYRGASEMRLAPAVVDYCLTLMGSTHDEFDRVQPVCIVYKGRMLTEDLTYALSNELTPDPRQQQQLQQHWAYAEVHLCDKHRASAAAAPPRSCVRCLLRRLYRRVAQLVCGFSIPFLRLDADVWRVLKLYVGLYLLMGNGSRYRVGL